MSMNDMIVVFSLTTAFTTMLAVVMLLFRHLREGRYNQAVQRAELDKLRASLEDRIYALQDRLLSTADRWRDVNHLLLDSQRVSGSDKTLASREVAMTSYLKQMGFTQQDAVVDTKLVFVLTPFHTQHEATFEAIRRVCFDVGLKCVRGDEECVPSDILRHILRQMVRARVIIANIEGRNANVFYELGIAHALGKPTILVAESLENVPFDVKSRRIILYEHTKQLESKLKGELMKTLITTEV